MSSLEQYLTLRIGAAIYGITIDKVREVVSYTTPSPMPNSSPCMKGVIKLRGRAVPVLDLRLKFGLSETVVTVDTCIIILELEEEDHTLLIGITADMVQQVAEFDENDLEPAPQLADGRSADWIKAMARFEDGFVIILDIEKTLAKEALPAIENDISVVEE